MSMLNIGTTALTTTQTSLATTSHNISNVNTEGYTRQRAEHVTLPPNFEGNHYVGSGVTIGSVERIFNEFLATQVRLYTSQEAQQDAFLTFSRQVDDLLGSSEANLSSGLESFFNAVHAVANDPTSISARQVMLTEGELLANRFKTLDSQLAQFDKQIDSTISVAIKDINSLSQGIADLNEAIIAETSSSGANPNDLLDQRDLLINKLSEYVSVTTLPEDSGAVSVFIGNGQALVVGVTKIDLSEIQDLSTDPPRTAIGYGPDQINITAQIAGGTLGGSIQARADIMDSARGELDALAQAIVTNVNEIHNKGVTLDGNVGGDFFLVPTLPTVIDAGNIRLAVTDPRDIAAAFPAGVTNADITTVPPTLTSGTAQVEISSIDETPPLTLPLFGAGANIELTFDNTTNQYIVTDGTNTTILAYNPATDSGKSFNLTAPFVELTLTLSGVPANNDVFTIGNSAAIGDNRNALAMADLQVAKLLNGGTRSFTDAYGVMVANVATRTHQADASQKTQQSLLDQAKTRHESTSGVNLDEEAANLIRYQQAYQAASQIITVSNTVFNALINAI